MVRDGERRAPFLEGGASGVRDGFGERIMRSRRLRDQVCEEGDACRYV